MSGTLGSRSRVTAVAEWVGFTLPRDRRSEMVGARSRVTGALSLQALWP